MSAVNLDHYLAEQENLRRLQAQGTSMSFFGGPSIVDLIDANTRRAEAEMWRMRLPEPAEMTLAEAVEVLNRESHLGWDEWKIFSYEQRGEKWTQVENGQISERRFEKLDPFSAIAIAREYERKRQG